MKESVGSYGSQCNWEEKTLMMFLLNRTLWNIKTLVNSDKKSVVFLILAFICDHGFFVTTEFIFGKGITLVAGHVYDGNSNHLLARNHGWALIYTNQLFAIDGLLLG